MLLVALVVGGCWHATPEAPGVAAVVEPPPEQTPDGSNPAWRPRNTPSPCDASMARAFELAYDELQRVPQLRNKVDDVRHAAAASCREMGWTPETLACFDAATAGRDVIHCAGRLTPDQSNDLQRRMEAIMSGTAP
ncbi:MAG: hypothetical protein KIT31_28585 [Deltaproteobacteria bacterium]|nr:hypothetical protein [Deltaproteobacteria bacterium]